MKPSSNRFTRSSPTAGTPSWRASALLHAPHRLAFFMAALMLALAALWWATQLAARALQWPISMVIPVSSSHALLMSLGYMPLFFCGFLFTAGPKWLHLPEVSARSLLPALATMVTGWMITLPGFYTHALIAAAGMTLVAIGWTVLSLKFARMVYASRMSDRTHPALASAACLMGSVMLWLVAIALAFESHQWLRTVVQMALWWFIAPVFAVVSHRMIPFFSASAIPALDSWRPLWLLWVLLGAVGLEGWISVAELWWWPQPAALRWLQVLMEAPVALLLLWLAIRWGLVQSLRIRLLAMLHGGFVWLGLSFALNALSHGLMAQSGDAESLGLAPLHAMTMGYLSATMFAMITRVSNGHGGRKEPADRIAWTLYWVLQTAIVLRVVSALWPTYATPLTLAAIGAWCLAMVGWAIRYGHWFGTPRPDGRPG
jgi:uncharacterized protein involved in response to NO